MTFTPATFASLIAFVIIVAAVLAAIVAGVYLASRRADESPTRPTFLFVSMLVTWLGIFTAVVATGGLVARPMPLVPIGMSASLLVVIVFALSPSGQRLMTLPLWMLVGFQSFRLPLEIVLHEWARNRTIPETMTWTGQNYDIVSGVVAILAAALLIGVRHASPRLRGAIAWVANLVGIILLLNVVRVAVMSSPLPFAWHVDPPLQLIAHLPYAWIVPVCVGGSLAGHIVLTRALLGTHSVQNQVPRAT